MKIATIFFTVFFAFTSSAVALSESQTNFQPKTKQCTELEFGLRFDCAADWKWKRVDNAILIIMSQEPIITLNIMKLDPEIKLLGQVNHDLLKEKAVYQEGFQTEYTTFAGKKAIRAKAFSKHFPNIRLLDYYYIYNGALYGVLFSIQPKEEWEAHQPMISQVTNSFEFLYE